MLRALLLFLLGVWLLYLSLSEFLLALSYESEAPPVAHYTTPLRQIVFGACAYAIAFAAFRGNLGKKWLVSSIALGLVGWISLETTRQVSRDEVRVGPLSLGRFRDKSCGTLRSSWLKVMLGPNRARYYLPLPFATERLARDIHQFSCEDKPFTQGAADG